ncbi:MAG: anaerobic ribonucleoside-triphosphate reductase activating protein [Termitinemataceae bacterium]|nr:MAG: anaerobic ribonucleoside-triphosphate reductase activating protein [Termitinemataceae bacterium]
MDFISYNVSFRKTSLVDYPGKVSAVIFFPHCNLQCPWCQNGDLIKAKNTSLISLDNVLKQIQKRKNILGGVVLTGGEPTLSPVLSDVIAFIKELDLLVKLDTNGTHPAILNQLLQNQRTTPSYIACDLKISLDKYYLLKNLKTQTIQNDYDIEKNIKISTDIIKSSNIEHEFRSLILPEFYFTKNDILNLASLVGDSRWVFRAFVPGTCLDSLWNQYDKTLTQKINEYVEYAKSLGKNALSL